MKNSIIIFIPYFGKWPEWIELFFHSLELNSSVDFHFFTDCDNSVFSSPNLFFHDMSFESYVAKAEEKIGVSINILNAYKICDLRPMFGIIHSEIIENYDFYGWCDIDLLFGDIRSFYSCELLHKYEVFSTHSDRISGHFALFKNTNANKKKYLNIYDWKAVLKDPKFVGIDEIGITKAYTMTIFDKINEKFNFSFNNFITRHFKNKRLKKLYLVEQFTTPFTPIKWIDDSINSDQPSVWYYQQGNVTNNRDLDRNFIYIHFMNFKSSQWRHDGTKAPWEKKQKVYFVSNDQLNEKIEISPNGVYVFETLKKKLKKFI